MNKELHIGSTAISGLLDQVTATAQLSAPAKNDTLKTIAASVGVLAKGGHIGELHTVISAIDKQVTAGGLHGQQWVTDFKQTTSSANRHFGNGHDSTKTPLTGSRRRAGAGDRISAG